MFLKGLGRRLSRMSARQALFICSLITGFLPEKWLYDFATFVARIAYFCAFKQRKIAQEGLTVAFGRKFSQGQRNKIARECFINMAKSGVEMLNLLHSDKPYKGKITIEGKENLDNALLKGKGVIAVSAHFGNFPLLLTRLKEEGYRVSVILKRMRDNKIEEFLHKRRQKIGIHSIHSTPRKVCVEESLRSLRDNEVLFIQLDQNFGTAGVFVEFFGKQAATATGPVVFALRQEAPVIPTFIVRNPDDSHKIIVEPEVIIEKREVQRETLRFNIQKITVIIETYIRKFPQEWGWIHRRWKSQK